MSTHDITLTVNGTETTLSVEARTLLVDALRDGLDHTEVKVGCETSTCGACTVHVDGDAVKACNLLAVQADGADVTTVAGLADGDDLHPLQERFHEEHALQCGYCTPGMVLTAERLLAHEPDPSPETIREGLKGNVCRCTGYANIVRAIEAASEGGD